MKSICLLLLAWLALSFGQNPYEEGPLKVGMISIPKNTVTGPELRLGVYYPKLSGKYPVVLFWSGMAGLTPASLYSNVFDKIASHGVVVAGIFTPESPDYEAHPNTTKGLIDYLGGDAVTKAIEENGTPGIFLDVQEGLILMGHSAGGHVVCNYLKNGCNQSYNPKGVVFWDPVDGFRSPCSGDFKLTFSVPTLMIGSDYFLNLCAPGNLNYHQFEYSWNCPRWTIAPRNFGHLDMMDDLARIPGAVVCGGNVLATPAQLEANRLLWSGASVSLIKTVTGKCEYLKYIEEVEDYAPSRVGPLSTSMDVGCQRGPGVCPAPGCAEWRI